MARLLPTTGRFTQRMPLVYRPFTRGRSPFMGVVLGSVSLRCAASAPCPVTVVKLQAEEPKV
jgi:universal stress protein family protein